MRTVVNHEFSMYFKDHGYRKTFYFDDMCDAMSHIRDVFASVDDNWPERLSFTVYQTDSDVPEGKGILLKTSSKSIY